MTDILSSLAYLNGLPNSTGKLKVEPEHFQVSEDLGFGFSGEGEHLMVRIRKTGENTSFVANELAKACGVKSKDVSWAGLKDRHAVTEQWLSVHLPKGGEPSLSSFLTQYPSIEVIETRRHNKKLRPGDLVGNHFSITLTEVSDVEDVTQRLQAISLHGVPNYFGSQRFGNQGNNLGEARRWGRENVRTRNQNKRSLYLSAARSWIFNTIVSKRIEKSLFDQAVEGDCLLTDEGIVLAETQKLVALNESIREGSVSITAALAGDNELPTVSDGLLIEQPQLDVEPDLMALIRGNRMRHERRSIVLKPQDLTWSVDRDSVKLDFSLDAGCFATALIRELIQEIKVERNYQ
ncbi:tRNA pseudouridine(13) synthase TruD [Vibrio tetraodonis]|uniref:tRNA pseudouridine(13) synthase TruD n=1 Tax=Vibrio tetraodonis TaxID=2231647 RepID=UPI000E0C5601|nr:tRNA pseudouridine(13) synthase TruD [Vibrio tetraodonis]